MWELLARVWGALVDVAASLWLNAPDIFLSLPYPLQFPFIVVGLVLVGQFAMLIASANAWSTFVMFGWELGGLYAFFSYLWASIFILIASLGAAKSLGASDTWLTATLIAPLITFYTLRVVRAIRH